MNAITAFYASWERKQDIDESNYSPRVRECSSYQSCLDWKNSSHVFKIRMKCFVFTLGRNNFRIQKVPIQIEGTCS